MSPGRRNAVFMPTLDDDAVTDWHRFPGHLHSQGLLAGGQQCCASLIGWTGGIGLPHASRSADDSPGAIAVDAELVIAVDVSNSMDPEEQALQREGYIAGLTSREFLSALRDGIHGRIAVTYFEWAGPLDQKIIMPWRLIDGADTASAVANEIAAAPYRRAPRTSIFGALHRQAVVQRERLSRLTPHYRRVRRRHQQYRPTGDADARRRRGRRHHRQRLADHAQSAFRLWHRYP
jgi:hypothetical protein